MSRYLFVSRGMLPIVAFADSRDAMRAYVRDLLGLRELPRHCVCRVA